MEAFKQLMGLVAVLDRANVDTDAIIPKQFLKSIERTGFGRYLFDEWRYFDQGQPGMDCSKRPINPEFELNQPRYQGATVLLAKENFGCGSSREHAPWALLDYGFRVIIAPSFADIFYNNCFKNGILPIVLEAHKLNDLMWQVKQQPGYQLVVDLDKQTITLPDQQQWIFDIDTARKYRLLHGLDDIDLTLQQSDKIKAYEQQRKPQVPWLFSDI